MLTNYMPGGRRRKCLHVCVGGRGEKAFVPPLFEANYACSFPTKKEHLAMQGRGMAFFYTHREGSI